MRQSREEYYFRPCSTVPGSYAESPLEYDSSSSSSSSYESRYSSTSTQTSCSTDNTTFPAIQLYPCQVLVYRLDENTLAKYKRGSFISAKLIQQRESFRKVLSGFPPHIKHITMNAFDSFTKDRREMERRYRKELKSAKRKQWCSNCLQLAKITCCWNRSYCSEKCQLLDWEYHGRYCTRVMKIDVASQAY